MRRTISAFLLAAAAASPAAAMTPSEPADGPGAPILRICQDKSWLIFFDRGSSQLSAGALDWVADLYRTTQQRETLRVDVTGHEDGTENAFANGRLSAERVAAVTRALIAFGMPADLLVGRAAGGTEPLVLGPAGVGAGENRRVEIVSSWRDGGC
jgi:outer membrane protein OmpA-like peptidoglycan-associated protein